MCLKKRERERQRERKEIESEREISLHYGELLVVGEDVVLQRLQLIPTTQELNIF